MDNKNLYKLKRITLKDGYERVGVLIECNNKWFPYKLITVNGEEKMIKKGSIEKISIVRGIDKEVRNLVNSFGKERLKINKKLMKLQQELQLVEEKLEKDEELFLKNLVESTGTITPLQFKDYLYKQIKKMARHREFDVYIAISEGFVDVELSLDVEKWASPERYSFLFREYDGNIFVNRELSSYKKFLKKYEKNLNLLNVEEKEELARKYKCKINQYSSFEIGDKNWLYYFYELHVDFGKNTILTKSHANTIILIMNKILK